jgi:hypothetical protein
MGIYEIETTITAEESGVCFFQTDCFAEIEYTVSGGELGWEITKFRFEGVEHVWNSETGTTERLPSYGAYAGPDLFPVLLKFADKEWLETQLREQLAEDRILPRYTTDAERAAYHAGVL